MSVVTAARTFDGRGKHITTFVVFEINREMDRLHVGEVHEVVTDDFEPFEHDLRAWCDATGHRLVGSEAHAEGRRFLIEKSVGIEKHTSVAMVISDPGLEELLTPLGFALAAALEGSEVHLFFQGPAVRVLARGYRPRLKGWSRPFTRFAAAGLEKTGHIAAQEKLRQLESLGARISACGPSMEHFKVDRRDLIFQGVPMIEYLSFMPVMERASVTIYS